MKFLQVISDSSQIDRSLEYDVLYYNITTDRIDVVEYNPITSTTYEVKNILNPSSLPYNATSMVVSFTGVKTETYKSGKVEVTETSETETVSFEANASSASTATRSGSFTWNEQSVAWSTTLSVVPAIKITMSDSYTDTSVIALTATKSASVEGTIAWSTDLASATAKIEGENLIFLKHYEGSVVVTATASNASAEKTITVTCDEEVTATTYELGTQSALADVPASTTSATVNYTVIPTYHYKLKDDFVGEPISTSKVVTFAANTSTTDEDTKSDSFTDSYGVTVNWSVKQLVAPSIAITMQDAYTDTTAIACSATKNISVKDGSLVFTMDLSSDIADLSDGIITFKQHYEGNIVITATALDKYDESNILSDNKTITVSCDVPDTITHSVTDVISPSVRWSDTSATVTYKCAIITTKHSGEINVVKSDPIEKVIEINMNLTDSAVTISGSFECEHGDTVEYSITQGAYDLATTKWWNDDMLIKELDVVGELSSSYKESACTRCEIGTNITSIGSNAFEDCTRLTSVTIPDSVTSIGSNAFHYCLSLTSVTIPNSVTSIGSYAFRNCESLTSIIIPDSVTSIGSNAFEDCTRLTSVTIPDSVTSIGRGAFYGIGIDVLYSDNGKFLCHVSTATTTFDIAEGTETIAGAFHQCDKLTLVTIPDSVTRFGNGAFYQCIGLNIIVYKGTIAQWNAITKGSGWKYNVKSICKVRCTDGDIPIANA